MTDIVTEALIKRIEALEARLAAVEPKPAEPEPATHTYCGVERDGRGQVVVQGDHGSDEAYADRMRKVREAGSVEEAARTAGLPRGWWRDPHGFLRDKEGRARDPKEIEHAGAEPVAPMPDSVRRVTTFRFDD